MNAVNMKAAVLIGRTGAGKSTIANMLVKGNLDPPHPAKMGHGMRGTTLLCEKLAGRGWTVVDTVGFGEGLTGTVPDEKARDEVVSFLKQVQGEYSHIIFVHQKGRADLVTSIIWKTFQEIFKGGEKNFVVLMTGDGANEGYVKENLDELKKVFEGCDHFTYANFPPPDDDEDDDDRKDRGDERDRLERDLLAMFASSVKPDICDMTNDQIEERAESILKKLARLVKDAIAKFGPKVMKGVTIFVSVASLVAQLAAG